jgi:hypothetical protein
MKKILLLSLLLQALVLNAQTKAVTETGEEVILYDDGSWQYSDTTAIVAEKEIPTNPKRFTKSDKSSFLVKSTRNKIAVWIDPKKWNFKKDTNNEDAEYGFNLKNGGLYGMMISEQLEVPLSTLKKIALQNAKSASPDLKILKEEYRTVNDKTVLFLQMKGTVDGIGFVYNGYYYSSSSGTVQLVTYSSPNLVEQYQTEWENLLNGLVDLE